MTQAEAKARLDERQANPLCTCKYIREQLDPVEWCDRCAELKAIADPAPLPA